MHLELRLPYLQRQGNMVVSYGPIWLSRYWLLRGAKTLLSTIFCASTLWPRVSSRCGQFTVRVTVPTVAVTELDEPLDVPVPVTVTVYVPAEVPAFPPPPPPPPPLPALPPPPQPIALIEATSTASPTIASQLRRRRGTPISSTTASAVPPTEGQKRFFVRFSAVVAAVVSTVSVDVCAVLPLSVTDAGLRLHVGGSLAAAGVMEQLRLTEPENPFVPATPIIAVFPVVAPGASEIVPSLPPLPLGPKVGSAVTVSETVVVALNAPEVPVTVTVTGPPNVAVLLADSVNT